MSSTLAIPKISLVAERSADPRPEQFTISSHAVLLGRGNELFPLRNITRVGKYYLKWEFPIIVIIGLILLGLILLQFGPISIIGGQFTTYGVLMLVLAAFGVWQRKQPGTPVFGFECASGEVRYIRAKDERFIDEALGAVTKFLESGEKATYHFDFRDNSVTNIGGAISGTVATGDRP